VNAPIVSPVGAWIEVPSVIWALTVLVTTATAAEPPTPTSLPLAAPSDGLAIVTLASALSAVTDTSPAPVIVTEAAPPLPTTDSLSLLTMLIRTEPATPMSPPPAPDVAVAKLE
jgi:hypothetical protein